MTGAEYLVFDHQRALEERPRRRKLALIPQEISEIDEACCRLWMLGPERLLADR
jgi:hypothetical protein